MDVMEPQLKSAFIGCRFYRSKSVGYGCGFVGARSKYNLITLVNLEKITFKFYFAADFYERLRYCKVRTHVLFE